MPLRLAIVILMLFPLLVGETATAQTEVRAILGGEIKRSFEAAQEVNVRHQDAITQVRVAGVDAVRLRLEYDWAGGDLDWMRLGKPGFAQRLQFREKSSSQMRSGRDYWYTASFFLPKSLRTVRGHTLSLMDFKHHIGKNGSVPTVQFAIANDGNFTVLESLSSAWRCGSYLNVKGGQTAACNRTETIGVLGPQRQYSGRWVHVVTRSRWSNGPDGLFYLWIDGRPVFAATGNTLQGTTNVEFKFGPYRHHMSKDPGPVEVYYSNVRRAETCEGLQVVDCSSIGASVPRSGFQNVRKKMRFTINELSARQ